MFTKMLLFFSLCVGHVVGYLNIIYLNEIIRKKEIRASVCETINSQNKLNFFINMVIMLNPILVEVG